MITVADDYLALPLDSFSELDPYVVRKGSCFKKPTKIPYSSRWLLYLFPVTVGHDAI